jgi:hypothetical protein
VKCTKQFALIAVKNAKFLSNPTAQDQYTAESVLPREGQVLAEEDTRHIYASYQQAEDSFFSVFFF